MFFFKKKDISTLTDLELIAAYKSDENTEAISILFKRYSHLVMGLCVNYLKDEQHAKDAVIAIFEKLIKDLKKHDIKHFKSWLYMVSKNFCQMELREQKALKEKHEAAELFLSLNSTPDENLIKEEKLVQLELAIQELEPDQRACVELFYLKEKCYQEVADITGFTMNQVKSYIQNGKRNLKISLTQKIETNF